MILDYYKATHQTILDVSEAQRSPLFCNTTINRKLPLEGIIIVLEDMAKSGNAAPIDKSKTRWEIYWHSLDEWGNIIYSWACNNGMNNTVCTIHELVEGDNTTDEGNYFFCIFKSLFLTSTAWEKSCFFREIVPNLFKCALESFLHL